MQLALLDLPLHSNLSLRPGILLGPSREVPEARCIDLKPQAAGTRLHFIRTLISRLSRSASWGARKADRVVTFARGLCSLKKL